MARYESIWVDYATEQYNSLPVHVRQAVMVTVGQLEDAPDPTQCGSYDKDGHTYRATFDFGFIVYAVVADYLRILLFRISAVY